MAWRVLNFARMLLWKPENIALNKFGHSGPGAPPWLLPCVSRLPDIRSPINPRDKI
jgi:hypothetical protein